MRVLPGVMLALIVVAGCSAPPAEIDDRPPLADEGTDAVRGTPSSSAPAPPSTTPGPSVSPTPSPGPNETSGPESEAPGGPAEKMEGPAGAPPTASPEILALREDLKDGSARVDAYLVRHISDLYLGTVSGLSGTATAFHLRMGPSPMLAGTWWERDGTPVQAPFVEVYEGHAEGDEDQVARLTLTWEWARGAVRVGDQTYLVRIGMDGNAPTGGSGSGPAAWRDLSTPPATFDRDGAEPGDCPGSLEAWAPVTVAPETSLGRSTHEALWADLVLDGDAELLRRLGEDTMPMMVAMAAEMDLVYEHEVAIRHRIAGVHVHTDPGWTSPPDDQNPLARLADYWATRHRERDIVHLVTGYDSSFAQANCISGAGMPDSAFTFTPFPWEMRYVVFHTHAFAHELGHIYSAHHHYGNHAESELATIMIQGYTPGERANFSSLSKAVIRGWAEQNVE